MKKLTQIEFVTFGSMLWECVLYAKKIKAKKIARKLESINQLYYEQVASMADGKSMKEDLAEGERQDPNFKSSIDENDNQE
jgi:hypothetical protein